MKIYVGDVQALRWILTASDGGGLDLTDATVDIELFGPTHIFALATIVEAASGRVEYLFTENTTPGVYQGRWIVHFIDGTVTSIPGVSVTVLDPSQGPWATIGQLETAIGSVSDDMPLAFRSLEAATAAVRGYITIPPDPNEPIPEELSLAVTIIAGRLYLAPPEGGPQMASEAIGDCRIAYHPVATAAASLAIANDPLLVSLLAPWRPRIASAYVGPSETDLPLPITGTVPWWGWTEEPPVEPSEPVLDMNPTTLNIEGVRAGDANERTYVLTQSGSPIDLTDAVLLAQARQYHNDPSPALVADIEVIDALAGRFVLGWPGDQVATVVGDADEWTGIWDLQVTEPGGEPVTVLQGTIQCEPDVTR